MGRRIKAQPDGACHLERTPSGQGFCPAAKLVTAGDHGHWTELGQCRDRGQKGNCGHARI